MRQLSAGALAVLILMGASAGASAQPYGPGAYPDTTPRQYRNQRGYDTGGYYERDSKAVPFGTRAWWELKTKEAAD